MSVIDTVIEKVYRKKGRKMDNLTIGSTIKVNTKIKEGGKERIQAFEGTLISKRGIGINSMFTVRKIGAGAIGVERTFPLHSPMIDSIIVVKKGEARRAKLYYLREAFGRKAKKEARRFNQNASVEELRNLSMKEEVVVKKEEVKADAPADAKKEVKAEAKPKVEAPKKEEKKSEAKPEVKAEAPKKEEKKPEAKPEVKVEAKKEEPKKEEKKDDAK